MTIKEAIIKVLDEEKSALTYIEVSDLVIKQNLIDWSNAKTPKDTISAQLGHFIRKKDTRVKRVKSKKGFRYFLTKHENIIDLSKFESEAKPSIKNEKSKVYQERDLHKLLSTYLKSDDTFSKTIFHEKSANSKDRHQKWIHPDMVGIKFLNLKNQSSQALMRGLNKADIFEIFSYELKREIKTDYELKQSYFQAVSNSSWSNHGYLVALEINENLKNEMKRLNDSFGIGIIELKANAFESEVLFASKYKNLDFKTIDKLCQVNKDFEKLIRETKDVLFAGENYVSSKISELNKFCDEYFTTDSEIEAYCEEKRIPNTEAITEEII